MTAVSTHVTHSGGGGVRRLVERHSLEPWGCTAQGSQTWAIVGQIGTKRDKSGTFENIFNAFCPSSRKIKQVDKRAIVQKKKIQKI